MMTVYLKVNKYIFTYLKNILKNYRLRLTKPKLYSGPVINLLINLGLPFACLRMYHLNLF